MPSQRLRRRARNIARASVAPQRSTLHAQIAGAQHDQHRAIQSVNSEGNAIDSSISAARHDFRHTPGLTGRDERIALETLARDRVYNAEGTAAQAGEVRSTTADTLSNLRGQVGALGASQQAAYTDALEKMLEARQSNRQAMRAAHYTQGQENLRELIMHPPTSASGSGSSSSSTAGLTPNEKLGVEAHRKDALALVRQALAESHKSGGSPVLDSSGKPVNGPDGKPLTIPTVPSNQRQWQAWGDQLYSHNHTLGISRHDVGWAIQRIQSQVRPDPLTAVGEAATGAATGLGLEVARLLGLPGAQPPPQRKKQQQPNSGLYGLPPYLQGLSLPKR